MSARTRWGAGLVAGLLGLLLPGAAGAVGLEGPAGAERRVGAGLALGVDQVGGFLRDAYPFLEVYGHADVRVWGGLVLGGAVSVRQDVAGYSFAVERWSGPKAPALAAQLLVGYDGEGFHLSVGPSLLSESRAGRLRVGLLPYGVLRLRVGSLDGWHLNLRTLDGAPFTAEGGAAGLRLMVGAPEVRGHRLAAGLYSSLGENTLGLALSDELALGEGATRLRLGGLLGTDLAHFAGRPEVTLFAGLVF
jgi:hypothetical protein